MDIDAAKTIVFIQMLIVAFGFCAMGDYLRATRRAWFGWFLWCQLVALVVSVITIIHDPQNTYHVLGELVGLVISPFVNYAIHRLVISFWPLNETRT